MAFGITKLTGGTVSNPGVNTAFSTASVTPTANALVYLIVGTHLLSTGTPTASGCGLTWTVEATATWSSENKFVIFKAQGASPSAGAITATPATGENWGNSWYQVVQITGVSATTPIRQDKAAAYFVDDTNGNSLSFTSARAAGTFAFSAWSVDGGAYTATPAGGWTELSEQAFGGIGNVETQYNDDNGTSTTGSVLWQSGSNNLSGFGYIAELSPASGVTTVNATAKLSTSAAVKVPTIVLHLANGAILAATTRLSATRRVILMALAGKLSTHAALMGRSTQTAKISAMLVTRTTLNFITSFVSTTVFEAWNYWFHRTNRINKPRQGRP